VGLLQFQAGGTPSVQPVARSPRSEAKPRDTIGPRTRGYILPIFSPRHHRHHGVDGVDPPSWPCSGRRWTIGRPGWRSGRNSSLRRWTRRGHGVRASRAAGYRLPTFHAARSELPLRGSEMSTSGGGCPPNRAVYPHERAKTRPRNGKPPPSASTRHPLSEAQGGAPRRHWPEDSARPSVRGFS
jgi:hypothetical protein